MFGGFTAANFPASRAAFNKRSFLDILGSVLVTCGSGFGSDFGSGLNFGLCLSLIASEEGPEDMIGAGAASDDEGIGVAVDVK